MNTEKNGISDISSSEGNLLDFSKVIWILNNKQYNRREVIFEEFGNITSFNSRGSFERKISIMEKIGLIEFIEDRCLLSSSGKVSSKIMKNYEQISPLERTFYFVLFFTSCARTAFVAGQH